MGNPYFRFKQFEIRQDKCAMKVTTDACLFGAWVGSLVQKDSKALDIGAGTGLLSLMMAQQNISLVESVEIEASCYQQLVENIGLSPWRQKVIPHLSDISKWTTDKLFDIVLSNPPFHQQQLRSDNRSVNLARHDEGLNTELLFEEVDRLLSKTGIFFLLMPEYRTMDTINVASRKDFFANHVITVHPSPKHDPFRTMFSFSRQEQAPIKKTIFIRNEDGLYNSDFSSLMEGYYL